jgi:hypothetical protein
MGLFATLVRFDRQPPTHEEIARELQARTGSATGLDSVVARGFELEVYSMLDPATQPYLLKILIERGGVPLDMQSREACPVELPDYVDTPWRSLPLWKRARIVAAFNWGLFSTAFRGSGARRPDPP